MNNRSNSILFSVWVCKYNTATVKSFAKKYKLPVSYVRKIANNLKSKGLMTSKRGRKGGYSLTKDFTVKYVESVC